MLRLEPLEDRTLLNAGALDPMFGAGGLVSGGPGAVSDVITDLKGRIVVVGATGGDFFVARYVANNTPTTPGSPGSLDTTFGTGGRVTTDFGSDDGAAAVAIQFNGKIVVVGTTGTGNAANAALARYNDDGSLDNTFGTGGRVVTPFSAALADGLSAVAIQDDGKIVVAGSATINRGAYSDSDFLVARYNVNGSLDNTFWPIGGGYRFINFGTDPIGGRNTLDSARDLAIQRNDDRIVVVGRTARNPNPPNPFPPIADHSDLALARLLPSGTLDPAFGAGGIRVQNLSALVQGYSEVANGVVIQDDGKIVVVGDLGRPYMGQDNAFVLRYTNVGILDPTFSGDGIVSFDFADIAPPAIAVSIGNDVALDCEGNIVVVGRTDSKVGLARFTQTGILDPTFGMGGRVTTDTGPGADSASAVAIQPNTRIVAVGTSGTNIALARYEDIPDPPVVPTIEGINYCENSVTKGGLWPSPNRTPDPSGAVGPNHLVSVVNASIEWHTKAGVQQNSEALASFFSPLTPVNRDRIFDPKVIYDQYAGKFVVVALEKTDTSQGSPTTDPANTSRILLAVSNTNDPNGNWTYRGIDSKLRIGTTDTWADFPGLAVDAQAIYVTANMFDFASSPNIFQGSRLWIVSKSNPVSTALVNVYDPSTAAQLRDPAGALVQAFTLQPAHMFGTAPAGLGTLLVSSTYDVGGGVSNITGWRDAAGNERLSVIRVDNPIGGATFTRLFVDNIGNIHNNVFVLPLAPQSGGPNTIRTNFLRIQHAVWRNNVLWATETIVPPAGQPNAGEATAHWYQIDTTNLNSLLLLDQGNVGAEDLGAGTHTFYPSLAVDGMGNMAIGFAASGLNIFPGAYYTTRGVGDPVAGTVRATATLKAGLGTYVRTDAGGRNRWGDYSSMALDPVNDSFWAFNEYALRPGPKDTFGEDGRWGTAWKNFSMTGGSISGKKYHDLNGNGIRDVGEPGLQGWTIYLDRDNDGVLDPGEARVVTDALGNYTFNTLAAGNYAVREVQQFGWAQTAPAGGAHLIALAAGQNVVNRDFGNLFGAWAVSGQKFHDQNGNGVKDAGEPGLQGWTIFIDANDNTRLDAGEVSITTDTSGSYTLVGLLSGTYSVREVMQDGWLATTPQFHRVMVTMGQTITGKDFGNARPGSISGVNFDDLNRNGIRESGEPGLANWTIYHDRNNNGIFDPSIVTRNATDVPKTISDRSTITSTLLVSGLSGTLSDVNITLNITHTFDAQLEVFLISPSGTRVKLFAGVGGSGDHFTSTTLDDQAAMAITVGAAPFSGSFRPQGLLADLVGENPNGTWTLEITDTQTGDVGTLNSWSLTLSTGDIGVMTDASGNYSFTNLVPASYVLREVRQNGFFQTFPASGSHTLVIASGQNLTDRNFGNYQVSVTFATSTSRGSEANSPTYLTVFLSAPAPASVQVTVNYAVTDGTATRGVDYRLDNGTITFASGQTMATIPIEILHDTLAEPDETIVVTLSNPVNATPGPITVHTYTIVDDDWPASFGNAFGAGSTGEDSGYVVTTDASGNVYLTGIFEGTVDFDPGPGTVNLTSAGGHDLFVAKYSASGALVWARRFGAAGTDRGHGLAVDGAGNVYLTGFFSGTVSFGAQSLTATNGRDIFVAKLDSAGAVVWARRMGAHEDDEGQGVVVDGAGNVYVTGRFQGQDSPADFGPFSLVSAGGRDIFVTKLDSAGSFLWARRLGGTGHDDGFGIGLDGAGSVYVTGQFRGTADFDPGSGTFNLISAGGADIFVAKLTGAGNFVCAQRAGGTGDDFGNALTVDGAGAVYVTGGFEGTGTIGPATLTSAGSRDVFVAKLDSACNFLWARRVGGALFDNPGGIVADGAGNVFTNGRFDGTADFDPGPGTFNLISAGGSDAFVLKLDGAGNLVWARQLGGAGDDGAYGIALDADGNVYTTGQFSGTADFDPGVGTFNLSSAGGFDTFVSKLRQNQPPTLLVTGTVGNDTIVLRDRAGDPYFFEILVSGQVQASGAWSAYAGITISSLAGDDTVTVPANRPSTAVTVSGGDGSDTLIGPDVANTWNLTGTNAGNLNGTVTFTSVENLTGGAGDDMFVFANGQGITGYLADQGGNDTLNYTQYTSDVYVWLRYNYATGTLGVSGIENVAGGEGNDILRGDAADNILYGSGGNDLLLGEEGNDSLDGGSGRNVLIGGLGRDVLIGGGDEDILIAGYTAYDDDDTALVAILSEWTRSDLTYGERVDHLKYGGGVQDPYLLDATSVFGDAESNTLLGGGGLDLFFANLALDTVDWDPLTEVLCEV